MASLCPCVYICGTRQRTSLRVNTHSSQTSLFSQALLALFCLVLDGLTTRNSHTRYEVLKQLQPRHVEGYGLLRRLVQKKNIKRDGTCIKETKGYKYGFAVPLCKAGCIPKRCKENNDIVSYDCARPSSKSTVPHCKDVKRHLSLYSDIFVD